MNQDDVVYGLLLVVSIAFGDVIRRIESAKLKQIIASSLGVALVYLVSDVHIAHPIFVTTVNAIFICCLPAKVCHVFSFAFSFSYLAFFRCTDIFGIPLPPSHTNAVQMILTLKLVGLAFEVHDTYEMKKRIYDIQKDKVQDEKTDLAELELKLKFQQVQPSFFDIFHYAFCYIGVLTGPYYKYKTYHDMLHSKIGLKTSFLPHVIRRMKWFPMFAILFVLSSYFFPLSYAKTEEIFEDRSIWYRLWYMTPLFFCFRMRFYSGFSLSEAACILAGLGAYPVEAQSKPGQGPAILQTMTKTLPDDPAAYDFETVHNIDEYGADFNDSVRGSLKTWNMTVQYWLAVNVHRRFPIRALRTTVTMLTSAFWHGVYSGYYLSMLTVPFILVAEDLARRRIRHLNPRVFDFFGWFMKIQWFSYMGIAFSLLEMGATLNYWRSIYYVGHVIIVVIYLAACVAPSPKAKLT